MDSLIVMRKPLKKYSKTNRVGSKQTRDRARAQRGAEAEGGDAEPYGRLSFVRLYNELCGATRPEPYVEGRPNTPAEREAAWKVGGGAPGRTARIIFETDYGQTDIV